MDLKNTLCTIPPSLDGDFMESLSSFLISCDPYFDEINSNRFAKLLVRLLEKVQFKIRCWCVDGDLTCWGVNLALDQVNQVGVGANYVCCLVIVVIFMGLEGAKR